MASAAGENHEKTDNISFLPLGQPFLIMHFQKASLGGHPSKLIKSQDYKIISSNPALALSRNSSETSRSPRGISLMNS